MSSASYRFRSLSKECTADDAARAKVRLAHAQEAGILDSLEGAIHDGERLVVMLDPMRLHLADRASFSCEVEIVTRILDRTVSTHSGPAPQPPRE